MISLINFIFVYIAEGLTLEDMGLTYVSIPIQIVQDLNQPLMQSSDNNTFLIDSSQVSCRLTAN